MREPSHELMICRGATCVKTALAADSNLARWGASTHEFPELSVHYCLRKPLLPIEIASRPKRGSPYQHSRYRGATAEDVAQLPYRGKAVGVCPTGEMFHAK